MKILWIIVLAFGVNAFAQGDYPPAAGQEGSTAIHNSDARIERWASACEIIRGPQDSSDTASEAATFGTPESAVGISSPMVVSLGDGGEAILTFDTPISNVVGFDFAIFENSFSETFLELAFVEVSSDGQNFFRFPSVSLTPESPQIGAFGSIDPTGLHNLAGKYKAQYGTPFDLEELNGQSNLDINAITHIKIIDVIGAVTGDHISFDSEGRMINDPWPTPFASSGFDLDAIAVLKPANVSLEELSLSIKLYPNPATNHIVLKRAIKENTLLSITDISGRVVLRKEIKNNSSYIDLSALIDGVYFLQCDRETLRFIKK